MLMVTVSLEFHCLHQHAILWNPRSYPNPSLDSLKDVKFNSRVTLTSAELGAILLLSWTYLWVSCKYIHAISFDNKQKDEGLSIMWPFKSLMQDSLFNFPSSTRISDSVLKIPFQSLNNIIIDISDNVADGEEVGSKRTNGYGCVMVAYSSKSKGIIIMRSVWYSFNSNFGFCLSLWELHQPSTHPHRNMNEITTKPARNTEICANYDKITRKVWVQGEVFRFVGMLLSCYWLWDFAVKIRARY